MIEYSNRYLLNRMLADNLARLPARVLNHLAAVLSRLPAPTPISYGIIRDNQGNIAWLQRLLRTGQIYKFANIFSQVIELHPVKPLHIPNNPAKNAIPLRLQQARPEKTNKAFWLQQVRKSIRVCEHFDVRIRRALALRYPISFVALKKMPRYRLVHNDISFLLIPNITPAVAWQYRILAQTAMLQAAVAYFRGGRKAFDAVKDPYGKGPFTLRKIGKKLVIQSALKVSYKRPVTLTIPLAGTPAAHFWPTD